MIAVIPARDEAESVGRHDRFAACARTIRVISRSCWSTTKARDGTADLARHAAVQANAATG